MITSVDLGERIRETREYKNMSQADLAQLASIPQSQISKIERGITKDPSFFTIGTIARALDIPVERLFQNETLDEVQTRVKQLFPYMPLFSQQPAADELVGVGRLHGMAGSPLVCLNRDDLAGHMLVTGAYGTGAAELVHSVARDVAVSGATMLIIDPRGDHADQIIDMILASSPARARDIVLVDLDEPIDFNPLDVRDQAQLREGISQAMTMLAYSMGIGGSTMPSAINYATHAVTALAEANLRLEADLKFNLSHVINFFQDPEFRHLVLELCSNPTIRDAYDPVRGRFEALSERQQMDKVAPVLSRFEGPSHDPTSSHLIAGQHNRIDVRSWHESGRIVILNLGLRNAGQASQSLRIAIGNMIAQRMLLFQQQMLAAKPRPLRIVAMECETMLTGTGSLFDELRRGHQLDYGLIMHSQFPEQLASGSWRNHVNNHVAFHTHRAVIGSRAKEIDERGDVIDIDDIAALPMRAAYARLYRSIPPQGLDDGATVSSGPFTITPPAVDAISRSQIKAGLQTVHQGAVELERKHGTDQGLVDDLKNVMLTFYRTQQGEEWQQWQDQDKGQGGADNFPWDG